MMQTYSVQDVEKVLRLPRSTLRGLISAGFVTPARGPRRQYRFSFQDLIVLRTARALIDAKVPMRRISRALDDLRRSLPESMPLSGLSISAVGDRVVVRDGQHHYQVDDGQYLLGLDVRPNGDIRVLERKETPVPEAAEAPEQDWFSAAVALEASDPKAALAAYERATQTYPTVPGPWTNWGRLLHEQGDVRAAERVYRRALEHCDGDALLWFNLAVLLEDADRLGDAIDAYRHAIEHDPQLADGHYNLARLYELIGKPQHAIRHFGEYRRLMKG